MPRWWADSNHANPFPMRLMSTTEDTLREARPGGRHLERGNLAQLADHRERAGKLLGEQRERFQRLHTQFGLRLAELADELARHERSSTGRLRRSPASRR
jgi:hypothetical protein